MTHLQYSYTGSGTLGEFIVTATPIFDSNGNVKYAVADRMDVRHLKARHELVCGNANSTTLRRSR